MRSSFDLLIAPRGLVRFGPGLSYVHGVALRFDDGSDYELGTELALKFVAELAAQKGNNLWIAPRAQVGLPVALFPSGDLARDLKAVRRDCEESPGLVACSDLEGARGGLSFGLGIGAILAIATYYRVRADFLMQIYSQRLATFERAMWDRDKPSWSVDGGRVLFFAGAELF